MITRVTTTAGSRMMLANLQASQAKLLELQDQLSSGKVLQRPSDSPARVLDAMTYRGELRRNEQHERNGADATSWLNTADSTLTSAVDGLQKARDLALAASNGSQSATSRKAAADEIRQIREGLIDLANTQLAGRPIFNGTRPADVPAYDASGAYQGDAGSVSRNVAPGVTLQVNTTGPDVFGAAAGSPSYGGNAFEVLDQLATQLEANDASQSQTAIGALDTALGRVYGVQATLGARSQRMEAIASRNSAVALDTKGQLSLVEDIDLPETIIKVKTQELAYQAALQATAKVVQPSLLDFLR
jgi:flagellar hook-associated protein 3 FlgL